MSRIPAHYERHADDLWDGYVPSDWRAPFHPITRWEAWRTGVIEGRAFGPWLTESGHPDPRVRDAYNAGVEYVARAMAGAA